MDITHFLNDLSYLKAEEKYDKKLLKDAGNTK